MQHEQWRNEKMKKEYIAPDAEVIIFSTKAKIMLDPGGVQDPDDPQLDGASNY